MSGMSENIEFLPGESIDFDRGLTNAEAFGPFAELVTYLRETYGLEPGVQAESAANVEGVRSETDPRLLKYDATSAADRSGPIEFELLIPNFNTVVPHENAGDGARTAFRDLLDRATTGQTVPSVEAIDIGFATIGSEPIARVTFSGELDPAQVVTGLRDLGIEHEMLRPDLGAGSIAYQPGGIINFQPGGIINFQPGGIINFQPGGIINFQPRKVLPQPASAPDDELDAYLRLKWKRAMDAPTIEREATIAVLDTGIDRRSLASHPLFCGNVTVDPWGGTPDTEVDRHCRTVDGVYGHGTHVAGIVAQRAPFATINHEAVRAGGLDGSNAFELARDLPDVDDADIYVFSFATAAPSERDVPALRQLVDYLLSRDKVVVVAAGTRLDLRRPDDKLFPADFEANTARGRLISVGAVDANGHDMVTSRAPADGVHHVKSYGVGVLSAFPTGNVRWGDDGPELPYDGWARWTGTSMAAPRVAAAIAHYYQTAHELGTVVDAADHVLKLAGENGGVVR